VKYIDEYRDPEIARKLLRGIAQRLDRLGRPVTVMEVCGSHTQAIGRYGIRGMLPAALRLVSGPGCPVCVTSAHDVDVALWLAAQPRVIFATFGDMLRVPGSAARSLQRLRAEGADIRIVASAADCIDVALANPSREVIFMGIGFETTSPTVAATIIRAHANTIRNFSVFAVHKRMPPAMRAIIADPDLNIDGFLCPGHVSIITGAEAYHSITRAGRAAVITGFEPVDVLEGLYMLAGQLAAETKQVLIQYRRGVHPAGNPRAQRLLHTVFAPADACWRGLGVIAESGLHIREPYAAFDARTKHAVPAIESEDSGPCRCGDILRGIIDPCACPLFRHACTPDNPVGPCMVSPEGTCATHFKYH
jgi:hydrogenase expression/formation protein HypD